LINFLVKNTYYCIELRFECNKDNIYDIIAKRENEEIYKKQSDELLLGGKSKNRKSKLNKNKKHKKSKTIKRKRN
jgi:hypothetical protein